MHDLERECTSQALLQAHLPVILPLGEEPIWDDF
jgi:hypothetical protein